MRLPAADYLEADKIEELANDLDRDGYQVEREASVGNQQFDLVARRNGELLVFEVKARSRLRESVDQLARLRAAAREAGVTSYRLVVVSPPREIEVTVEGLETALASYFLEELPSELDDLSAETTFQRVSHVYVDAINVRSSGVRVRGSAGVTVELNFLGKRSHVGMTVDERLPFSFDVELGDELKLARVNEIKIDVSDFTDSDE